ncbi:MAG TPA: glycoside hydrolase family 15 protein [Ktedonobacteraceae bacterium]
MNAYGVIGDCHSVVLVAPDGSVDWGCLPDFDSPAIFCRLLDAEQGGYFQIAPSDPALPGSQRYLRGSNVLQTRFASVAGEMVLTDFMPVETLSAWQFREMNNNTWRREDGSCHCLVRIVECTHGELAVRVRLKVTPDYAAATAQAYLLPGLGAVINGGEQHVGVAIVGGHLLPTAELRIEEDEGEGHPTVVMEATLREGERLLFAMGVGRSAGAAHRLVESELHQRNFDWELAQTLHCWREWISSCSYSGAYAELVQRSALVLKMMTYAPTGAIVASPTTSLPEEIGGERNWDYRFTWLRDGSFTLYALSVLGFTEEAHAFTHWLRRLSFSDGEDLQIMYGIRGERELVERVLEHLSGYEDSRPVRIGNGAVKQKQLDVFGEVLDCLHLYRRQGCFERYGEKLEGPLWELMCVMAEHVCKHWREPDKGIWEVRSGEQHFVYSKVMCWVALDRVIRAVEQEGLEAEVEKWRFVREQIRTDVLARGYNTQVGAFTQYYGGTNLDASCLLLPLVGFVPPDDPRMRSTVDRVQEQLTDERGLVYRYNGEDGLEGREGTFTLCSFWLVDNLAMQGRVDEARSLFERLVSYAGRLGLFSEEIDEQEDRALGNYPQAFTHIALINSAHNLRRAELRMAEHHTDPVVAAIKFVKP